MSNLVPLFAACSVVNIISATINTYFLISSRHFLQPTQRFAPWLLLSSIFQAVRYLLLAIAGQSPSTIRIYDVFTTLGTFVGFTYFVCYILLLLKQAYAVAGKELDRKRVCVYLALHFVLAALCVLDLIAKNVQHNTLTTGVKYAFYFFYTTLFLVSIDYLGFGLIRYATVNAAKCEVIGGQNLKTQLLNPLKKTLIFFSCICIFGMVVFAIQAVGNLRTPVYFPSATTLNSTELFSVVLLTVVNFLTTLHAWIYLERCERRRGKDTRRATTKGPRDSKPARLSVSHPPSSKSIPGTTVDSHDTSADHSGHGANSPPVSPTAATNSIPPDQVEPVHTEYSSAPISDSSATAQPADKQTQLAVYAESPLPTTSDNSNNSTQQQIHLDIAAEPQVRELELQPLARVDETASALTVGSE